MTISSEDAKARARRLRTYLSTQGLNLSHSQSLEAVANEEGFRDWNTLSARLMRQKDRAEPACPFIIGGRVRGLYHKSAFAGHVRGLEIAGKGNVWRIVIQFDAPLAVPLGERLNMTRSRVRLMVDRQGRSVNLVGTPDGNAQVAPDD